MLEDQVDLNPYTVDFCFYSALEAVRKSFRRRSLVCFLQILAMSAMLIVQLQYYKYYQQNVVSFFALANWVSLMGLLGYASILKFLSVRKNCVKLAIMTNHQIEPQVGTNLVGNLSFVNQEVYNIQNRLSVSEMNNDLRIATEKPLQNAIRIISLKMNPCTKTFVSFSELMSFALLIYGIVVMVQFPTTGLEKGFMISYIVLEFFAHIQIFACIIFIALFIGLLPLVCIIICFVSCCCKQNNTTVLPDPVKVTAETLKENSSCSICFQDFNYEQEVIALPCSPTHIFHPFCIARWAQLKSTCPICRQNLT